MHNATQQFGETYGIWDVDVANITKDSIIYSFGVANNISWELEMIKNFGCEIHAFDMTPGSIEWIKGISLPPQFNFHPYGIAHFDGLQYFRMKKKKNWPFHNASTIMWPEADLVPLPVKTLSTIMKELGHKHIDVLKMDIEGSEYKVLKNIKGVSVTQILVEMHTPTKSELLFKWIAQLRLFIRGYHLIKKKESDYTYIKN